MNEFRQHDAAGPVAGPPGPQRMSQDELESILRLQPPGLQTFTFLCPVCGNRLRAEVKATGRVGQCPACEMLFNVPPPDQAV